MNKTLSIKNLRVSYGRKIALSNLSLEISLTPKIIGLFGPNGAGKTTTMMTLAGLLGKYTGKICFPKEYSICFVPDRPYLYGNLKIADCIELFCDRYSDFSKITATDKLKELGISLTNKISSLSMGMLEQVHLVLSFSRTCDLYILDEPLAAIDPFTREKMLKIILGAKDAGATILLSTHIIMEVEEIFDEIIMISDGKLVMYDNVKKLQSKYSTNLEEIYKMEMNKK